jgi:hypothetical protein
MPKVKPVARKDTPGVEKGRTYNFGEFFHAEDEVDAKVIDFVLEQVREHGISRRVVVRDAMIAYADSRVPGPYTTAALDTRESRDAAKQAKAEERMAKREEAVADLIAEIQQVKGVTRKQAGTMTEKRYRTWSVLSKAEVDDLSEISGISQSAAKAVIALAKTHVESEKPEKPEKAEKPVKKTKASKTKIISLEDAAAALGVTRLKVKKMVESGKIKGAEGENGMEITVPSGLTELDESERLAAVTAVAK